MLVVLPVRVVWDLLVALGRMLHRSVLGPMGRGVRWLYERVVRPVLRGLGWVVAALLKLVFVWPWVALWRYVLVPAGRGLAWSGRAVYAYVLTPIGRGIAWTGRAVGTYLLRPVGLGAGWVLSRIGRYLLLPLVKGLAWLAVAGYRYVLLPPARAVAWLVAGLYAYVLAPGGRAIAWVVPRVLKAVFVWPWAALWRYVLAPVGRGLYAYLLAPLGRVLVGAWHLAGRVSRALGRGLVWLWRGLVVGPAAWAYRHVATPVGNAVRRAAHRAHRRVLAPAGHTARAVWRTSRLAVREARADVRRALFGGPPGEPARSRARTLGSNTAAGDAPAPEISLDSQG